MAVFAAAAPSIPLFLALAGAAFIVAVAAYAKPSPHHASSSPSFLLLPRDFNECRHHETRRRQCNGGCGIGNLPISIFSHQTRRDFAACLLGLITVPIIPTEPVEAMTPDQASQSYDGYAATYDKLDGGSIASSLGIDEARTKLLEMARGDVLEIGVGTGLNLASYRFGEGGVTSLTLVDVSEGMLSLAESRIQSLSIDKNIPIKFARADATAELVNLFGENKFDTVVDTFSLCVMGDAGARKCLEEMVGVVKASGTILMIENTRSSNPLIGGYQDLTASSAADLGGKGCVYNQNVGEMIRKTKGMRLEKEDSFAAGLFRSFVYTKS